MKEYKQQFPGSYYFDTFTFTTLGTSGSRGPDVSKTYANAPWSDGDFYIQDGQQYWTVPATGTYQITAAGAYGATPGRVVSGQVNLNEGQTLQMLVGQQPTSTYAGGGTWIVTDKLLMVASGGDGTGGHTASFSPYGSGLGQNGAGYLTDGLQTNSDFKFISPKAFVNGGFGNRNIYNLTEAGFGGGNLVGGGGYTGSPGDGVSGATCYADSTIMNFTDLGASSNSTGYVTVSLIDPSPIHQIVTLGREWTINPTVFPPTTSWSSVAYGNSVYVSVSNNGTFPVMYSRNGIEWLTTTTGAFTAPWTSVTFGNGKFVAVSLQNVMYSTNGINWTSVNPSNEDVYFKVDGTQYSLVTNFDGSVVALTSDSNIQVYKNRSLIYTIPESSDPDSYRRVCAMNYDGSIISRNGNVYTNGILTRSYPYAYYVDMNADGTKFVFNTGDGNLSVYENESLLYTLPCITDIDITGSTVSMNDDGAIVTVFAVLSENRQYNVYTNGIFTYSYSYPWSFEERNYSAMSKDGTTLAVNSYVLNPEFITTLLVYKNGGLIHEIEIGNNTLGPICINYDGSIVTCGTHVYINGVFMYSIPTPLSYIYYNDSRGFGRDSNSLSWDAKMFQIFSPSVDSRVYLFSQLTPVAPWTSVVYGNNLFISLASSGESMYSIDASLWTLGNTVPTSSLTSLTYGNNKFVAISNYGTSNVVYSVDGSVWSNVTTGTTSNAWTSVSYGNGRFLAVSSNATSMYSLNAVDWETGGSTGVSSNCLSYGTGYFACPSSNSEICAVSVSPDGQTWQTISLFYTAGTYSGITYGDNGFVTVSSTGVLFGFTPFFWVSPLQVNNSTKLNSINWSDLAYGNGSFVAVGPGLIQTTQDYGNTWSSFAVSNTYTSVEYSSVLGTFVALPGLFTDGVYTSTDGNTWTVSQTLPDVQSARTSLTYGDGKFVAVLDGNSNVFYSRDGINWDVTTSNVGASWSVTYGNQSFVAVSNCITSYSYDAINWTSAEHTEPAYSFYAGGTSGYYGTQMAMSSDGSVVCSGGTVYINGEFAYDLGYYGGGVAMNADGSVIAIGDSEIRVYKNGILDNTIYSEATKLEMSLDGTVIGGSSNFEVNIYKNGILSYTLPTYVYSFALSGDGTTVATQHPVFDSVSREVRVYKEGVLMYNIQTQHFSSFESLIKLSSDGTILAHSYDYGNTGVTVYENSIVKYRIAGGTSVPFAMTSDGSTIVCAIYIFDGINVGPSVYYNGELIYQVPVENEQYFGYYAMNSDGSIFGWSPTSYSGLPTRVYKGFYFNQWSSLTYGNGLFVAVANPGISMYSSDGINWLPGNAPLDTWTSVSYGNGYFITVSDNGTYPVIYSQDGIHWTTTNPGAQINSWGSIEFGDDKFLVIPASGATTMTINVSKTF